MRLNYKIYEGRDTDLKGNYKNKSLTKTPEINVTKGINLARKRREKQIYRW